MNATKTQFTEEYLIGLCKTAAEKGESRCELDEGRLRAIVMRGPCDELSSPRVCVALWHVEDNRLVCVAHFKEGRVLSFRAV